MDEQLIEASATQPPAEGKTNELSNGASGVTAANGTTTTAGGARQAGGARLDKDDSFDKGNTINDAPQSPSQLKSQPVSQAQSQRSPKSLEAEFHRLKEQRLLEETRLLEQKIAEVEAETHEMYLDQIKGINEQEQRELEELEKWKSAALESIDRERVGLKVQVKETFDENVALAKQKLKRKHRREGYLYAAQWLKSMQTQELSHLSSPPSKIAKSESKRTSGSGRGSPASRSSSQKGDTSGTPHLRASSKSGANQALAKLDSFDSPHDSFHGYWQGLPLILQLSESDIQADLLAMAVQS
eukprot:m.144435 g.144435  ORF g.144435 m.144435 type:complete len:300 (+) comp14128_c0_seq4:322-1221(+)